MRYLRRVLARTTGPRLGSLQAARPQRWSSQAADPFAAADAAAAADPGALPPSSAAASRDTGRAAAGDRPAPFAVPPTIGAGALQDGAGALDPHSRPRRILDRVLGSSATLAPPIEPRLARGDRRDPEAATTPPARAPSIAGPPAAAIQPPSGGPPLAPPAARLATSRPGDAGASHREERSTIAMPPPVTPRREPAIAAGPSHDEPSGGVPERAPALAAAPIPRALPASPAVASRPEIVIGRISVVVDSPRPPAAAPRTIIRRVTAAAGAADGDGAPQRFGRFGLGQL